MNQLDEERYLRTLPVGYTVKIKEDTAIKMGNIYHLRGVSGTKMKDGGALMIIEVDVSCDNRSWKSELHIPYVHLTCETIRVVDAISIPSKLDKIINDLDVTIRASTFLTDPYLTNPIIKYPDAS